MIIGIIIELGVGVLLIVLGLLLWRKRMISLLHDYHYRNVKQEDIPAYTREMGIGIIIIGAGIILTGVLNMMYSSLWWIPLAAGFILGLMILFRAQMKYNGSVIS